MDFAPSITVVSHAKSHVNVEFNNHVHAYVRNSKLSGELYIFLCHPDSTSGGLCVVLSVMMVVLGKATFILADKSRGYVWREKKEGGQKRLLRHSSSILIRLAYLRTLYPKEVLHIYFSFDSFLALTNLAVFFWFHHKCIRPYFMTRV